METGLHGLFIDGKLAAVFQTEENAELTMIAIGANAMERVGYVPDFKIERVKLSTVGHWADGTEVRL